VTARARGLFLGPVVAVATGGLALSAGFGAPAAWTAAITALCVTWWVLEPVPVAATALVPFVLFPLAGVQDHTAVARAYGHPLILLFMGGFMLSAAVARSGVHRRMALGLVRLTGGGGRRVVLGFMLASWACSMWISNTATVLMLLPVALAVVEQDERGTLAVPLFLGIAYAASIGGVATPIGSPPNLIFLGVLQQHTGQEMSFLGWMRLGLPVACALLPVAWLLLTRGLGAGVVPALPAPGPWRPEEVRVLVVFGLTALGWIFRTEPLGGWSAWIGAPGASDSTVALAGALLLFLLPDGKGARLLDWDTARRIPWHLLLLFGGGLAISGGFEASGLSLVVGQALGRIAGWNLVLAVAVICVGVTFLTEVTSNTATATVLLPILAAASLAISVEPVVLMVPATMSASCAFMLPVATPPNAIVAGTDHISTRIMAREGFWLNWLGAATIALLSLTLF
jgi:solute carrier family 13 (sodium-dependent dicarboxylate transporter), member 2/3/5